MSRNLISTCKRCRQVIGYKASGGPMSARPGYWFHILGTWVRYNHVPEPGRLARLRAGLKDLLS
jgi:hypothetical protein